MFCLYRPFSRTMQSCPTREPTKVLFCVAQALDVSRGLLLLLRLRLRLRLRLLLLLLLLLLRLRLLLLLLLRLRLRLRLLLLLLLLLLLILMLMLLLMLLLLLPASVSEARQLDLVYRFAESCGTDLIGAHLQQCRCPR